MNNNQYRYQNLHKLEQQRNEALLQSYQDAKKVLFAIKAILVENNIKH